MAILELLETTQQTPKIHQTKENVYKTMEGRKCEKREMHNEYLLLTPLADSFVNSDGLDEIIYFHH